ncbi:MAG: hypothetical protein HWQ38_19135 [Nostoc sp. NMS7]|uniref:hypothetical protein n=1 Tax=Nostoc sp. NMS7 TaxID=2815391 RepID=UPI0025CE4CAB|nr:hypothetical protein [Nostoc sp. NMS7]MBN3948451.1 hypothetical protein [Nostoc sp. NMS7]
MSQVLISKLSILIYQECDRPPQASHRRKAMTEDIDTSLAIDKPGVRSLTTTSQLQTQIDLCAADVITLQQFYLYVGTELGALTENDWDYLQQNNCIPSEEMVRSLLAKIDSWQVVDTSKLHQLIPVV